MSENKDGEKGSCCDKTRCCGGKALAALVLLALGWAGGYFCGRRCAGRKMCHTPPEASAPAAPAAPAK